MQTHKRVEDNLVVLLSDDDYKVIALKGRWGTGKSYVWRQASTRLPVSSITQRGVYISIFGAKTINELKLRLLENLVINEKNTTLGILRGGGGILARGLLQRFAGTSGDELALISLPKLLTKRLVIIDDVERKHKDLH